MDQARSAISNIFRGEPRSYTRFSLAQNMEGENSHVEMKLSNSDADEEVGNSVGDHPVVHVNKSSRSPKNVCFLIIGTVLLFLIGFLIGYLANRRQKECLLCPTDQSLTSLADKITDDLPDTLPEQDLTLDWSDLKRLLGQKITTSTFMNSIRDFISGSHEAGSEEDERLAISVYEKFKSYDMKPWTDEHFVKVQVGSSENKVTYVGSGDREETIASPTGYLAYSATGEVMGRVIYCNYGTPEDFKALVAQDVQLNGTVVLLRAGKLSFAEKVANAEKMRAAAVLIYPDRSDYASLPPTTDLFGHVHLGSGDPYTPGFPSFNHTQFPPSISSGLPKILAQTISADSGKKLLQKMKGDNVPAGWMGSFDGVSYRLGADTDRVKVKVNNVLLEKKIHNIFGVIKGNFDPDRYVVIGAQRDAWGPGFAKSTIGTALLVELARAISEMVTKDGYQPRRSIVFASWSAGDFGSIGATEWQEGYLSSLHLKAVAYINLDRAVLGSETFRASASPLLYNLIESVLQQVKSPTSSEQSIYAAVGGEDWENTVMEPMKMDDAAYTFLTFSGIPSVSFSFIRNSPVDDFLGTAEDTRQKLESRTQDLYSTAVAAAQVAGLMALRLTHDHLLRLDVEKYSLFLRTMVSRIVMESAKLQNPGALSMQWLKSGSGDYSRAARTLLEDIENSDVTDAAMSRYINDRIMRVEHGFLSPYVSPKETPFRHIFYGAGPHTLESLLDRLGVFRENSANFSMDEYKNWFALATWTIQGCANGLSGDVWDIDNEM
uniref:Transferrin receptor protein 1 n=1 Tax=Lepisosteus oculatus TaxID=7918 RepID=W5MJ70_LEPOC|nr:PREDICTED: transferrin receptor protein 1 [Lepisosteus oculatus]XP_015216756.1 PREDICTED: transferrin receptor protein 1 [Lepisosteus oculatus]